MTDAEHDAVTKVMTSQGPYGTGVNQNPYWPQQAEVKRRHQQAAARQLITDKIVSLTEPRFVTGLETSEFIEALIAMTDSRTILEVGTHVGYTTLHMLRAVIGKPGAEVITIDARPTHDRQFFGQFFPTLQFVQGWSPEVFSKLAGGYDFVFIDSDHSIQHTEKELTALWALTKPGTIFAFHDCPAWQTPDNRIPPPIRDWLLNHPQLQGLCLRSCEQLDCLQTYGVGYPIECNPGLGLFIRK